MGTPSTGTGRSWIGLARCGALALVLALLLVGLVYVVLPSTPAHASCDGDQQVIVTATAANTRGYITTIDDADLNGASAAVPFVSQLYTSTYDPHPLGMWYDTGNMRWTIFNEDLTQIPLGTSFTVDRPCAGQEVSRNITRVTATTNNVHGASLSIDDPLANGNPNAVIYATQDWTGTYDPHEIGVQYGVLTGNWLIFNLDQSAMPIGASFDIAIGQSAASPSTLIVTASATNTVAGYMVYVNDARFNNQPGLAPIVSQVYPCGWLTCGVLNSHPVGVWYDRRAGEWVIYNVDRANIVAGAQFFITPLV